MNELDITPTALKDWMRSQKESNGTDLLEKFKRWRKNHPQGTLKEALEEFLKQTTMRGGATAWQAWKKKEMMLRLDSAQSEAPTRKMAGMVAEEPPHIQISRLLPAPRTRDRDNGPQLG